MKDPGQAGDARSGTIVALLLASVSLAAVLAWQAQLSARSQRAAVEKILRDYAALAADEFARRTANELGYTGFYPLVTALRGAGGPLPAPADLAASPDETVRRARDLVRFTFRYDAAAGRLDVFGPPPPPGVSAWLKDRLAARRAATPADRRYETLHGNPDGALRSFVFATTAAGPLAPIAGFEADGAALALRFARARERGPLFPASLAHGAVGNDALFLRVLDPFGREVFRAGAPREPFLPIRRPFGSDYNAMLDGFVAEAAVDPAAAGSLVIGGLPRSRLPLLLGVLAVAAGLVFTAVLQLRRERALARLRSDFVSRVSHELRTPLAQIRLFAETLLLGRVRSEDEARRSLEIIDRESRRLAALVENVLRFSRSERGEDRVDPRPLDVVPVVRQVVSDFQPLAEGRARVVPALPDRAVALADEDALRQILLNLLDNALKYGPAGQTVTLAVTNGPDVTFTLEDEGPGVARDDRERIWDRFYRSARHRASAVAGTGIGLAIVRELARAQGGSARVEDAASGGARFVVVLPSGDAPA